MRRIWLAATIAIIAMVLLYICIPPLPAPTSLANRSYSSLIKELGIPDESHPEKYIAWHVDRVGFWWSIQVPHSRDLESVPREVQRTMSIGRIGYSVTPFRQTAYSSNHANPPAP